MKIRYYKDSNSFFLKFTRTGYQHTFDVSDALFVDVDWEDRVTAVESIMAIEDLGTENPADDPPNFVWVERSYDPDAVAASHGKTREFIHDREQDIVYLQFAGGEWAQTVEVCENVRGYIKENLAVAGILITSASTTMDLEGILADGPPTIEFVDRIAEIEAQAAAELETATA